MIAIIRRDPKELVPSEVRGGLLTACMVHADIQRAITLARSELRSNMVVSAERAAVCTRQRFGLKAPALAVHIITQKNDTEKDKDPGLRLFTLWNECSASGRQSR